jgi:hypothetical protein
MLHTILALTPILKLSREFLVFLFERLDSSFQVIFHLTLDLVISACTVA